MGQVKSSDEVSTIKENKKYLYSIKNVTERLRHAWNTTETKWYPIPVGLGLGVIGYIQYRHVRKRELKKLEEGGRPRPKYTATGPWQVTCKAGEISVICEYEGPNLFDRFMLQQLCLCVLFPGFGVHSIH